MIRARLYEPSDRGRWDEFVAQARTGHFMFSRDYLEYHGERFADASLLFHRDERLVAVLPAHRDGEALVSHAGLPFAGVLSAPRTRLETVSGIFDAIAATLAAEGLERLVYRAVPHPYHRVPAEEDLFELHRRGATLFDARPGSFIPLGAAPGFSRKRREALSRPRRAGVRVGPSKEIGAFMDLCAEFLQRRHAAEPLHSREEMELLASRFPDAIRLYAAWAGESLLGGLVVYRSEPCSRVQHLAMTEEGIAVGAIDAVYDHVLHHVPDLGRFLDVGTSLDPTTGEVNSSLLFYKESLGASVVLQRSFEWAPGDGRGVRNGR